MLVYEVGFLATREVLGRIKGRAADGGVSLPWLVSMAIEAGTGDHIEIGTLYGASAIAVALGKKWLGMSGDVYCVDPWGPRNDVQLIKEGDPTLLAATREDVLENAALFGVDLKLIQASSDPWPEELATRRFVSGYIDGAHKDGMPYKDFLSLSQRVEHHIGFDNYEEGYPDVMDACNKVVTQHMDWVLYFKNTVFCAFRRRTIARELGDPRLITLL